MADLFSLLEELEPSSVNCMTCAEKDQTIANLESILADYDLEKKIEGKKCVDCETSQQKIIDLEQKINNAEEEKEKTLKECSELNHFILSKTDKMTKRYFEYKARIEQAQVYKKSYDQLEESYKHLARRHVAYTLRVQYLVKLVLALTEERDTLKTQVGKLTRDGAEKETNYLAQQQLIKQLMGLSKDQRDKIRNLDIQVKESTGIIKDLKKTKNIAEKETARQFEDLLKLIYSSRMQESFTKKQKRILQSIKENLCSKNRFFRNDVQVKVEVVDNVPDGVPPVIDLCPSDEDEDDNVDVVKVLHQPHNSWMFLANSLVTPLSPDVMNRSLMDVDHGSLKLENVEETSSSNDIHKDTVVEIDGGTTEPSAGVAECGEAKEYNLKNISATDFNENGSCIGDPVSQSNVCLVKSDTCVDFIGGTEIYFKIDVNETNDISVGEDEIDLVEACPQENEKIDPEASLIEGKVSHNFPDVEISTESEQTDHISDTHFSNLTSDFNENGEMNVDHKKLTGQITMEFENVEHESADTHGQPLQKEFSSKEPLQADSSDMEVITIDSMRSSVIFPEPLETNPSIPYIEVVDLSTSDDEVVELPDADRSEPNASKSNCDATDNAVLGRAIVENGELSLDKSQISLTDDIASSHTNCLMSSEVEVIDLVNMDELCESDVVITASKKNNTKTGTALLKKKRKKRKGCKGKRKPQSSKSKIRKSLTNIVNVTGREDTCESNPECICLVSSDDEEQTVAENTNVVIQSEILPKIRQTSRFVLDEIQSKLPAAESSLRNVEESSKFETVNPVSSETLVEVKENIGLETTILEATTESDVKMGYDSSGEKGTNGRYRMCKTNEGKQVEMTPTPRASEIVIGDVSRNRFSVDLKKTVESPADDGLANSTCEQEVPTMKLNMAKSEISFSPIENIHDSCDKNTLSRCYKQKLRSRYTDKKCKEGRKCTLTNIPPESFITKAERKKSKSIFNDSVYDQLACQIKSDSFENNDTSSDIPTKRKKTDMCSTVKSVVVSCSDSSHKTSDALDKCASEKNYSLQPLSGAEAGHENDTEIGHNKKTRNTHDSEIIHMKKPLSNPLDESPVQPKRKRQSHMSNSPVESHQSDICESFGDLRKLEERNSVAKKPKQSKFTKLKEQVVKFQDSKNVDGQNGKMAQINSETVNTAREPPKSVSGAGRRAIMLDQTENIFLKPKVPRSGRGSKMVRKKVAKSNVLVPVGVKENASHSPEHSNPNNNNENTDASENVCASTSWKPELVPADVASTSVQIKNIAESTTFVHSGPFSDKTDTFESIHAAFLNYRQNKVEETKGRRKRLSAEKGKYQRSVIFKILDSAEVIEDNILEKTRGIDDDVISECVLEKLETVAQKNEDKKEVDKVLHSLIILSFNLDTAERPNFLVKLLQIIQYRIFRLNETPPKQQLQVLARFYVIYCLKANRNDMITTFAYDALCCLSYSTHLVIKEILDLVPDFLPYSWLGKKDPFFLVLTHSILSQQETLRTWPEVKALKQTLCRKYKYKRGEFMGVDIFNELMKKLKNGEHNGLEKSLIVLAKRHLWHWTYKTIMLNGLIPLIEKWKDPFQEAEDMVTDDMVIIAIHVLGYVARGFDQTLAKKETDNIINILKELTQVDKASELVEDAVLDSLVCLAHVNFVRVADTIFHWKKKFPFRKSLTKQLFDYKPLRWWNGEFSSPKYSVV